MGETRKAMTDGPGARCIATGYSFVGRPIRCTQCPARRGVEVGEMRNGMVDDTGKGQRWRLACIRYAKQSQILRVQVSCQILRVQVSFLLTCLASNNLPTYRERPSKGSVEGA